MTTPQGAWREFAADWLGGLDAALTSLGGGSMEFDLTLEADLAQAPRNADSAWFRYRLSDNSSAELAVVCDQEAVTTIGAALLGDDASSQDLILETFREAVTQASAASAAALARRIGRTLQWAPVEYAAAGGEYAFASVATLQSVQGPLRLWIAPSSTLVNTICALSAASPEHDEAPSAAASTHALDAALDEGGGIERGSHRNLELLLDLELDLSVSFGRTVLPLDEVVRMTVGSIVQLNRSASDPVDVLVNNSVVARGEVVMIDGNYGVRVTQVASRQKRLEQML